MKSNYQRIVLVLILTLTSVITYAYEFTYDGLIYTWVVGDYVRLYGISKLPKDGKLVVPEKVYDYGELQYVDGISDMRGGKNLDLVKCIVINDNVDYIDPFALTKCSNLSRLEYNIRHCGFFATSRITDDYSPFPNTISEVLIGDNVEYVPKAFLSRDLALEEILIPNSVTKIGRFAFKECSNLKKVEIGEKVATIGRECYSGSSNIETITSFASIPPSLDDDDVFDSKTYQGCILYVPLESISLYKEAKGWKNFFRIYAIGETPIETITFDTNNVNLFVGEKYNLTVTVEPANITNPYITWSSNNEAIATIGADGTVTAVSVGVANITATCGEATATCKVTVNPVLATGITLNVEDMTLLVGQSDKLTATILPENTTDKTVTWTSDNDAVATVSEDGTVTAISVGVANITATCGEVTATCKVTVNPITASNITLNVEDMTLFVGQSDKLTATVLPENTTDKIAMWTSDNEAVATVSEDGTVTAVSVGVANITATCGEATATCKVTVNPVPATGITLNVEDLTLLVGQSDKLSATILPENTTDKTMTWESDNETVATVGADGTVSAVSVGVANITATCGGVTATCKVTVNPITATGITLNVEEMTLLVGQSDKLSATIFPDNTTDKTVTWSSDNEAVATVDADGTVTAVSVGVATITATCGEVTAICKVTVNPVPTTGITLNVEDLTLLIGQSDKFSATILPENTTDKTVTWTSDNEAVATVSEDGTVTAISVGVAEITATCGEVTATCKVTVNPVTASNITLNVEDMTLLVGQSDKLTATVLPENTTDKTVTWTSDNEAVATVSEDGTVSAVSVGVAEITATCGEVTATCKVTVNPITATGITFNVEEMTLLVGQSDKLTATILPENTTDKTVTWTSDDEAVATVSEDGTVTAVSVGVANITATCGEVTATCKVTVNPVPATGITLNAEDMTLLVGQSDKLTATILPENTTDKTVAWRSDNEAIATISADGIVTGVAFGVATITASCGDVYAVCRITVMTKAKAPTQLLRKGDGSSNTFVAMMEQDDKTLEGMGYRYVFGYDDNGSTLIEDTPWRYAHTDSETYWNSRNDFWVFAYYVEADGTVCVSSRRHLDGRLDNDFNPGDFIGKTSVNAELILGIYTIDGHYVGKDLKKLASGIYIVKTSASSYKIIK